MTRRQVFIDTETTGISARNGHRIIELAAVEAVDGRLTGRTFHTYLDPERSIDPGAQRVHGIDAADLVGKPRFAEIAESFLAFVRGAECLMHNATFDTGFIDAELRRIGHASTLAEIGDVTCTLKLARKTFPGQGASLDDLIVRADLALRRQHHSALDDAQILARIYFTSLAARGTSDPANARTPTNGSPRSEGTIALVDPTRVGMEKVIELVHARQETFFYRNKNKRIIDHRVVNERRWKAVSGPLLYAVTDHRGVIRYIGKWESATPLHSRWLRHKTIHHQERARNFYIAELDAGRGPLAVWSVSVAEIRRRLPTTTHAMSDGEIAANLEALWIQRWKDQLAWNERNEPLAAGFHDGDNWRQ